MQVVHVYRDLEKYRVGNKLIEPSGSRSDRPALQSMLKAAARDEFDVILAWREDRLYRGLRSMLTVLETIQDHKSEAAVRRAAASCGSKSRRPTEVARVTVTSGRPIN